jgi:hypothetical protein
MFVDDGQPRTWADLHRAVSQAMRRTRVGRELQADAVQHGLTSLLVSIDRQWFRAAGGWHYRRCWEHAVSRGRRYAARQLHKLEREKLSGNDRYGHCGDIVLVAASPTEETGYLASNDDLRERIQNLVEGFTTNAWADLQPLLVSPTELAAELGITHQSAGDRQAVLRRQLHRAAVDAGILGKSSRFYDL